MPIPSNRRGNQTSSQHTKFYTTFGVEFTGDSASGKESIAYCPFCAKKKFSVNVDTGLSRCWVCGYEGNKYKFMEHLWNTQCETTNIQYEELSHSRGYLSSPDDLRDWVRWCQLSGCWVTPGYNAQGSMNQLYRYNNKTWYLAPDTKHGLLGVQHIKKHSENGRMLTSTYDSVYIAEGLWDTIAMWESLRHTRMTDEGEMKHTNKEVLSLLHKKIVLGVAGSNAWSDFFRPVCRGKRVVVMFDNDHPEEKRPGFIVQSGLQGMERTVKSLTNPKLNSLITSDNKALGAGPSEVMCVNWGAGTEHYGWNPNFPDKYDVNDHLCRQEGLDNTWENRVNRVDELLEMTSYPPPQWTIHVSSGARDANSNGSGNSVGNNGQYEKPTPTEDLEPCTSWKVLRDSWEEALVWNTGLEKGLLVSLAIVLSTKKPESQIWARIMAPPSSAKTELAEAISTCEEYVEATSHFKGFFSGYNQGDGKDVSYILRVKGKTFIIKDGDTLMTNPKRDEILAQLRDVYDRVARTSYKTGMGGAYKGLDISVLIYGTSSLTELDNSDLGERFISCNMEVPLDTNMKYRILKMICGRVRQSMKSETGEDSVVKTKTPELARAYALTGGFVKYLRDNSPELTKYIDLSLEDEEWLIRLSDFVSYMRSRPRKGGKEKANKEFPGRLLSQYTKLAYCLAGVLGQKSVTPYVMKIVMSCGMDTADGIILQVVDLIYNEGKRGAEVKMIAVALTISNQRAKELLVHLKDIGAAVAFTIKSDSSSTPNYPRWRLTREVRDLYTKIVVDNPFTGATNDDDHGEADDDEVIIDDIT